ncbi:MAG: hypothetical protein NC131_06095 [Roseburia sp.]|nr:hypothetical protein [Roseburia sp.]
MSGNIQKSSKDGKKRIPRPYGATSLAAQYHVTKDEAYLRQFQNLMIQQWCLCSGNICGNTYDIQSLSRSLNVPVEAIRIHMRDEVLKSRVWETEHQEELLKGLIGTMVSWTLEDRLRINGQINLLTASQGGTYKPFISAELNKAMKMGLESTTAMQSLVGRLMGGGQTTNIFNMFQQNNEQNIQNNFVTRDEVLEILTGEQKQLPKNEQALLLETRYDIASLPEVVATRQEGIDTSKEGLGDRLDVKKLQQATDNLKAANQVASEDHHSMRREIELNIDPDEEDPELLDYEDTESEDSDQGFSTSNFLL